MNKATDNLISFIQNQIRHEKIQYIDRNEIDYIFKYGKQNRLLYYFFNNQFEDIFTTDELNEIKKFKNLAKIRYLELINEISSINKLLIQNNIKPIFLKGAYFYLKGIQNRYCQDIDILITKNDYKKTIKILLDNGYKFTHNREFDIETYDFKKSHQIKSLESVNGVIIDLHHRLTSPLIVKGNCSLTQNVVDYPDKINFGTETFLCPDWNDAYLHISYHSIIQDQFSVGPSYIFDLKHLFSLKEPKFINFRDYDRKYRNLLKLSLGISRYFKIKDNIEYTESNNLIVENSIMLLLSGNNIQKLNKRYKAKSALNIIKSLKLEEILSKAKDFTTYIYHLIVNLRSSVKMYILKIYLNR